MVKLGVGIRIIFYVANRALKYNIGFIITSIYNSEQTICKCQVIRDVLCFRIVIESANKFIMIWNNNHIIILY